MSFAHLPDRVWYFWIEQNLGGGWIGRVDFTPLTGTYAKIHALTFKFDEASLKVYNEGEIPPFGSQYSRGFRTQYAMGRYAVRKKPVISYADIKLYI